jgi:hypothetical protein
MHGLQQIDKEQELGILVGVVDKAGAMSDCCCRMLKVWAKRPVAQGCVRPVKYLESFHDC